MIYQRVKCLRETVENYQSQWWDWWSQLLLASFDMAAGEATGSRQHDFTVSRKSTNWFFAYTKFSMLLTTCTNRIDLFESTAEILANENRGWWTQLYFAIWVGWSRLSTGMKPTDSEAGLMRPTANNSANLNGALETDYAFDGWQMLLLSAHTNSLISQGCIPGYIASASIAICHKMVRCTIEQDIGGMPQSDVRSPDTECVMEQEFMKHKLSHVYSTIR